MVDSDGQKCDLVFLEDRERLNSVTYIEDLTERIFPWAKRTYGESWWYRQDGARARTAANPPEYLSRETPGFFTKDLWSPLSFMLALRHRSFVCIACSMVQKFVMMKLNSEWSVLSGEHSLLPLLGREEVTDPQTEGFVPHAVIDGLLRGPHTSPGLG